MLAGFVVLAIGAAGAGADGVTPDTTALNLGVGSSTTLHPTLHLDAAPRKADIILALDTTGSMGAAITQAQNDANAIVSDIQGTIPGARFAVVDFKDYPISPFGGGADYPWKVDRNFTDNSCPTGGCDGPTPIASALNGLSASGGSDEPEAYNTAFYNAYSDTSLNFTPRRPAIHDRARGLASARRHATHGLSVVSEYRPDRPGA